MSTLTVTNPNLSDPANKAEVEQNFSDIESWAAGGIGNDNIAANAAISLTKLEASKEHMHIQLTSDMAVAVSGYPLALTPLTGLDGDTAWNVDFVEWATNDFGAGTAAFQIQYGYFTATNVWTGSPVVLAAPIGSTHFGRSTVFGGTLTLTAQQRAIALEITTNDATAGELYVTVRLSRDIST